MSATLKCACGNGIKQKHVERAAKCGHEPPKQCFSCICAESKKKTPRERKIILAKERARLREAAKQGVLPI